MSNTDALIPAWVGGVLTPVDKIEVHRRGLRHKAISVFVTRPDGATLLQRRAAGKYHTPGLWTNTCCTHPYWNESAEDCAQRRLKQELGITGLTLEAVRDVEYRTEVGNGLIEHESVRIFTARARDQLELTLNPDEVSDTRWILPRELVAALRIAPSRFTPWLAIYMRDHGTDILGAGARA